MGRTNKPFMMRFLCVSELYQQQNELNTSKMWCRNKLHFLTVYRVSDNNRRGIVL